ncbi:SPW repeat protein [Ramlibacter sp.]|uniref:SPW repeat protein n=1 Tax=Ramlibacter sp. TaxID=1917967 RepID=UPI002BD00737|nr:SPW repeat protein [Ramlibacter sp.]HWI80993.1 SPW repeat protein [Ramlibacter sp.]
MKQLKHWQDSGNAVLGLWLAFSPLVLGFHNEVTDMGNTVLVGVLLLAAALGGMFVPRAWEDWTETALGGWLAIAPWAVGFTSTAATVNALVVGLIVLTLALWALQDWGLSGGQRPAH